MNPLADLHATLRDCPLWLIGNGPSLTPEQLDHIAAEAHPSIAMNRIDMIFDRTAWRPTHYIFCSENCRHPQWGVDWSLSVMNAAHQPGTIPIVARRYKEEVERRAGRLFPSHTRYLTHLSEYPIGDPSAFSTDATLRLDKSGTTMHVALQLAYWMGADPVYLLGCDSNWQTATNTPAGGDPNHFHPGYHAHISDGQREFHRMNNTHLAAAQHFKAAGRRVLNATPGSAITAYPKTNVEEMP